GDVLGRVKKYGPCLVGGGGYVKPAAADGSATVEGEIGSAGEAGGEIDVVGSAQGRGGGIGVVGKAQRVVSADAEIICGVGSKCRNGKVGVGGDPDLLPVAQAVGGLIDIEAVGEVGGDGVVDPTQVDLGRGGGLAEKLRRRAGRGSGRGAEAVHNQGSVGMAHGRTR